MNHRRCGFCRVDAGKQVNDRGAEEGSRAAIIGGEDTYPLIEPGVLPAPQIGAKLSVHPNHNISGAHLVALRMHLRRIDSRGLTCQISNSDQRLSNTISVEL